MDASLQPPETRVMSEDAQLTPFLQQYRIAELTRCVQALLAAWVSEDMQAIAEDDGRIEESEGMTMCPSEMPFTLRQQGSYVIFNTSDAMLEQRDRLEQRATDIAFLSDEISQSRLAHHLQSLKDLQLDTLDNVLSFIFLPELRDKADAELCANGEGFYMDMNAFVSALNQMMQENQKELKALNEEYGSPTRIDMDLFPECVQSRAI